MDDLRPRLAALLGDAYRIRDELGGGGMSRVLLAEEVQLGRDVVVKVLPPELAAGVNAERFRREIQLAARLQHPHVVPLIAAGQSGDLLWYTMPYIKGETVRARLSREHELPVNDTVRILRDVADALAYAHEQGVVHRDIKPDNVLLSGHHAVVTDFGVAKAIAAAAGSRSDDGATADHSTQLTSLGVALGTPAYMAPEQAAADPHTDHRADIYSFGALGYEMLTGRPPFEGSTPTVLAAHATKVPMPVTDWRAAVPPALAALVMKCLEKRPADRVQTAAELHGMLEAMATPTGGTPPISSAMPAWRATASAAHWRIPAIVAGIVAITVVGVLIARSPPSGKVVRSAERMAIMPFVPTTPDSALTSLGRNLVVLVSASVDGVGEIHTVEPTTVLARATKPPTLDDAFADAGALGAASVVFGTLVSLDHNVRLDAALYDTRTRAVVARAGATAPAGNMAQLADSTAWALLTAVWRARGSPTVSGDALTGRPIAAVREFVDGESDLARGEWGLAAEHYERAVAADSQFWLAYRRFAFAKTWAVQPVPRSYVDAYRAHRAELPARERDLVTAQMTVGLRPRIDSMRAVATRYPDFWPAWLEYADLLYHQGSVVGIRAERVLEPWEYLRRILPSFRPTYEHLVAARAATGDSAGVGDAIAEWRALGVAQKDGAADVFLLFTAMARLRVRESAVDPPLIDSVLLAAVSTHGPAVFAAAFLGEVAFAREVGASVDRTHLTGSDAFVFRRAAALALAKRGQWTAAVDALTRLGAEAQLDAYEYAAIGRAVDGVDSVSRFASSPPAPLVSTADARLRVAWADGLSAWARNDRASLAAARGAAAAAGGRRSAYVQLALDVLLRERDAGKAAAAERLLKLERTYADSSQLAPKTAMPVLRVLLARWLLSAGRPADADWALEAFEGQPSSSEDGLAVLRAVASFHRGVAADALGEHDRARRFYQHFINGYDLAPPHQRVWIDSATAALARR